MKNLLLNPNTTPVQKEYLDWVEIESVTDKQFYGYAEANANSSPRCGIVYVDEPGWYTYNGNDFTRLELVIGEECTDEFFNLPSHETWDRAGATVYRCNVTIEGLNYIYFIERESTYDGYVYKYYDLFTSNDISYSPSLAEEGNELWTGTYNLANGNGVTITRICWGSLYDADDNEHRLNVINSYEYFTVRGHDDLYYCDGWKPRWTQEYGDSTYWCNKLPNGNYQFQNGYPLEIPVRGSILSFRYHMTQGDFDMTKDMECLIDSYWENTGEITVYTSAGTETAFTQGYKIIYEYNGSKVYSFTTSIENYNCYFFTGTTWDHLSWVGNNRPVEYLRINPYEVISFRKVGDKNVMVAEEPTVAYVEDTNKTYYTSKGVPIYCENTDEFIHMLKGNPVTFDRRLNIEISNNTDFECGGYYLSAEDTVKLEAQNYNTGEWTDITEQFRSGAYTSVNLWRLSYMDTNGYYYRDVRAFRVTFTERALKTLVLNGYINGCSY